MNKKINKMAVIHWLEGQNVRRAAIVANLVIVVVIAFALAKLTWAALDKGDQGEIAPKTSKSVETKINNSKLGGDNIAALHIFGTKPAAPNRPKRKPPKKPASRPAAKLNLTLKGILYSEDPRFARAMIEDSSRNENSYAIGSSIKGQAIVDQINRDNVVLVKSDKSKETLKLPDKTANKNSKRSSSKPSRLANRSLRDRRAAAHNTGLAAAKPDISLGEVREMLQKDPDAINQVVRISPISRGKKFLGFRVSPGKNRNIFKSLGLKVGDIVTAVDGVQLDSPQKGFQVIEKLASASSINLTVKSGSTERVVTLNF
ncbi:MAG: type II secretion system protein GspC [Gammaproteobacteria bacterium]|nr:MAG: type II secretion system protein GspC [Gammaproteobacteria bacterium]